MPNLRQFLYSQITSQVSSTAFRDRRDWYINKVNTLFESICEMIGPESKDIYYLFGTILLEDDVFGSYNINNLIISFGEKRIIFEPKGTGIIKAWGRIDIKISNYDISDYLVLIGDREDFIPENATWKFSNRRKQAKIEFSEHNLVKILIDIFNTKE